MAARSLARTSAALLSLVVAAGVGEAQAQNYDGAGLLKFGIFAQGARSSFDVSETVSTGTRATTNTSDTIGGLGGGLSFGYDWSPHKRWLIGIEADAAFDGAGNAINFDDYSTQYLATFRARLGHYLHPGFLLYGTVGYALLGVKYVGDNNNTTTRQKEFATLDGIAAGAGFEHELGHSAVLFGEYLYTGFHKWEFTGAGNDSYGIDVNSHLFRLGVKFKYGHDHGN